MSLRAHLDQKVTATFYRIDIPNGLESTIRAVNSNCHAIHIMNNHHGQPTDGKDLEAVTVPSENFAITPQKTNLAKAQINAC